MKTSRRILQACARVAVILLRRSTAMQDKSIEDQRVYLRGWAAQNGYTIVGEYVDDAISGDDHDRRGGFQRLLEDLEKRDRPWHCILTYDRARFTRADLYEAATYAHQIMKAGVDVFYCAEGKSLATDHEIVWAVETSQKHEVLKQTSRDTLRGMLALAKEGFWCGGPIPYGYDAEIVDKFTRKPVRRIRLIRRKKTHFDGTKEGAIHHVLDTDGRYVREIQSSVDDFLPLKSEAELTRVVLSEPKRIEAARLIFTGTANQGMGLKGLAKELNAREIPPPGGHGYWRTSAIKAILDNPIYMGVQEWNSRTEAKYNFIQNGTMVPKPRALKAQVFIHEEQDRIRSEVPAIVSSEIWHRAQALKAQRADRLFRNSQQLHAHSALGGKLICAACGAKMYAHKSNKTKPVAGKPKTYTTDIYVCSTYLTSGSDQCGYNTVTRLPFERFVLSKIRDLIAPRLESSNLRQKVHARLQALLGTPRLAKPQDLRKRISKLEEKIGLLDRFDLEERRKAGMEAAYHQAKEELAVLSKQLAGMTPETGPAIDLNRATNEVVECLSNLEDFDKVPVETQKSFFARFVERIVLSFRRVPYGKKRSRSILERGVLSLFPLPAGPVFRPAGSGGGI